MNLSKIDFQKFLILALVAGCVLHPASAAAGLLIVFASQVVDKYFTRNIADSERKIIESLKGDVKKLSEEQQKIGLSKAFGGRA
jgi:hypothetical protein